MFTTACSKEMGLTALFGDGRKSRMGTTVQALSLPMEAKIQSFIMNES